MGVSTDNNQIAAPGSTPSTDSFVALAPLDARPWRSVSYTIVVSTHSIDWEVMGANQADYSDEVVVQSSATVAAGAVGSYSTVQAPFLFYRVKIKSTGAGQVGNAVVTGAAKP